MADVADRQKILAGISDTQVLALEQAAIRIPSTTFEEGVLADHFSGVPARVLAAQGHSLILLSQRAILIRSAQGVQA